MSSLVDSAHNGRFLWTGGAAGVRVCFTGKRVSEHCSGDLDFLPTEHAWLEQVHGGAVVEAALGASGRADALFTRRKDLVLRVVTADCVPILVATESTLIAIHAGWRGLAKRVIANALEKLSPRERPIAWVGPAIGPCCYEVGRDVAHAVVGASPTSGPPKCQLDLVAVARLQLQEAGVVQIQDLSGWCTRCSVRELWSYRRDGTAARRNAAYIWRDQTPQKPRGSLPGTRS